MNRNAHRHGRAPTRIGTGVEVALEHHARDDAVGIGANGGAHCRWMALGRRCHGLGPRIGERNRAPGLQRDETDQRLDRKVELRAEAATGRGRHDAHILGREAEHGRRVVAVHEGRLRAGLDDESVTVHECIAGFRFDIGVLDIGRRECAGHRHGSIFQRRVGITAAHHALDEQIAGTVRMHQWRALFSRFGLIERMRHLGPEHRKIRGIKPGHRVAAAGDERHGFAAKPDRLLGECRLVGIGRNDTKSVATGNVGCREDGFDARPLRHESVKVTECEGCMPVRRTHDCYRERLARPAIGAEWLGAGNFRHAVEPHNRRADGAAGHRILPAFGLVAARHLGHCREYLAIAGAAAQNAAERIRDLFVVRAGIALEQCRGGDEKARRADAALCRPMAQEGRLQRRQRPIGEAFDRAHRSSVEA